MGKYAQATARYAVAGVNFLFLLFGIIILIIGILAYSKTNALNSQANLMSQWNITVFAGVILACGVVTIITCLLGFVGAWFKIPNLLKMYTIIMICLFGVQMGMGIYLLQLNVNDIETTWQTNTADGLSNRIAYQNYLDCCGWSYWTDSIGSLGTPCPFSPPLPGDSQPEDCHDSTQDWLNKWIKPVGTASIVISCFEITTLVLTCFFMFQGKGRDLWADDGFHY